MKNQADLKFGFTKTLKSMLVLSRSCNCSHSSNFPPYFIRETKIICSSLTFFLQKIWHLGCQIAHNLFKFVAEWVNSCFFFQKKVLLTKFRILWKLIFFINSLLMWGKVTSLPKLFPWFDVSQRRSALI